MTKSSPNRQDAERFIQGLGDRGKTAKTTRRESEFMTPGWNLPGTCIEYIVEYDG